MKKKIWIAVCFYAAALLCAGMALYGYLKEKNAGTSYDALREVVTVTEDAESKAEIKPAGAAPAAETAVADTTASVMETAAAEPAMAAVSDYVQEMPSASLAEMVTETALSESAIPVVAETDKTAEAISASDISGEDEVYIDFEELQKLCPDAYAWIRVPGTNVDYPIVQSPTDNAFYMDHNPKGDYEYAGSIFTEDFNSTDFEDPNTVIYGHNMKNGSMFQTLHRFEDKEFFDEHREFEICLPDRVLHYQIFAAYTYDDRHLLRTYDFKDENVFRMYLNEILGQKSMDVFLARDVEVTPKDKIVTLSTCNGVDTQRYLVQGVLLSE